VDAFVPITPRFVGARGVRVPSNLHRKGPLNLVFDSTGLKVFGEGEWQARKHGYSKRRGWKKLHIVMCAETQQVVAASISDKDLHDSQGRYRRGHWRWRL